MPNSFEIQVKKLSFALGAVADGAYLWAGADKGIVAEIEGKDVGDTIYYRITNIGEVSEVGGLGNKTGSGDSGIGFEGTDAQAAVIRQRVVPVLLKDINVMYTISAWERMCTSVGEAQAGADVGSKLMIKACNWVMSQDIPTINNIFVGDNYKVFQLAGAYLKSYQKGKIYGFMDWQVWGDLTSRGQAAVPCNLAKPEFGNNLEGKWSLIDELRTIPDIPMVNMADTAGATAKVTAADKSALKATVEVVATTNVGAGESAVVELPLLGINTADKKTAKKVAVVVKNTGSATKTVTAVVDLPEWYKFVGTADEIPSTGKAAGVMTTEAATYAGTIIRCDRAQVFGCANEVKCEGGKYTKSSADGVTVHCNTDGDVKKLNTYKRYDLVFAGKLIEPRAAAMIWYKI